MMSHVTLLRCSSWLSHAWGASMTLGLPSIRFGFSTCFLSGWRPSGQSPSDALLPCCPSVPHASWALLTRGPPIVTFRFRARALPGGRLLPLGASHHRACCCTTTDVLQDSDVPPYCLWLLEHVCHGRHSRRPVLMPSGPAMVHVVLRSPSTHHIICSGTMYADYNRKPSSHPSFLGWRHGPGWVSSKLPDIALGHTHIPENPLPLLLIQVEVFFEKSSDAFELDVPA